MPAFTALMSSRRPGKRPRASATPAGTPISNATSVAVLDTSSESQRTARISALPEASSPKAWRKPSTRRSIQQRVVSASFSSSSSLKTRNARSPTRPVATSAGLPLAGPAAPVSILNARSYSLNVRTVPSFSASRYAPLQYANRRHLTIRRQRLEVGRATLRWLSAGPDAGREDQEQRDADDHLLSPTSASFIPATGTNNGWPNFSRPKVLITRWVSGATMKSANALPPAVFTRGPLAGFTSRTE